MAVHDDEHAGPVRRLQARPVLHAHAELAESPRWDDRAQRLLWVDILRGELHAFDPDAERDEVVLRLDRHLGAAAPREDGGFALAAREGIVDPDVPFLAGRPELRCNDARADRAGRLWVGVLAYDPDGPLDGRALYRVEPDGAIAEVVPGLRQPNGMDWSPDDRTLFFADTLAHAVYAFPYDAATGELGERTTHLDLSADGLLPDGLCVDADGGVWAAIYGRGEVHRYTPEGQLDVVVDVPGAQQVSSPGFGGPDLDRLFITTALENLDEAQRAGQPNGGSILVVDDPGHRGQPTTRVA
jgi:sugar lactone lactonase YvrE